MALKKPSQSVPAKSLATSHDADVLARQLADKPYGDRRSAPDVVKKAKPLSISLPPDLIELLEDTVRRNKRLGDGPKTVSALIRVALEETGYKLLISN